jgi:hypothetical protein
MMTAAPTASTSVTAKWIAKARHFSRHGIIDFS